MIELQEPTMIFPSRLNKLEKINLLKQNIQFLQSVKNNGVVIGSEHNTEYFSFMGNDIYKNQVEDWIMDLTKTLFKETQSIFKTKSKNEVK